MLSLPQQNAPSGLRVPSRRTGGPWRARHSHDRRDVPPAPIEKACGSKALRKLCTKIDIVQRTEHYTSSLRGANGIPIAKLYAGDLATIPQEVEMAIDPDTMSIKELAVELGFPEGSERYQKAKAELNYRQLKGLEQQQTALAVQMRAIEVQRAAATAEAKAAEAST